MSKARYAAAKALIKLEKEGSYSGLLLDPFIKKYSLSAADAAFFKTLVFGITERRITLDACIDQYARIKTDRMPLEIKTPLRLGIYQLLFSGSVPDRAAVNESTELVKNLGRTSASGMVNAVLRSFIRDGKVIPLPDDMIEKMSLLYSSPLWLTKVLTENLGTDTAEEFLKKSLTPAPVYGVVNTLKTDRDALIGILNSQGTCAVKDSLFPNGFIMDRLPSDEGFTALSDGLFFIQDRSFQLCREALCLSPGQRLLDCCAAPGSKSFGAAIYMNDTGETVSCDIHQNRVDLISEGTSRLGLNSIRPLCLDATVYDASLGMFDRVLADVPCSGIGSQRRKPDIKYRFGCEEDTSALWETQYSILKTASRYLLKGGRLIYMTCTLLSGENEQVVQRFLESSPDFSPAPLNLEQFGITGCSCLSAGCSFNSDGFFIAAFTRDS